MNNDGKAFCVFILLTDALELNIFFIRLMWLYLTRPLTVGTLTNLMSNNSPGPASIIKINILSLPNFSDIRRTPGKWMNEFMHGWVVEWMSEKMNEWMGGWVDEWMNEWMYRWMNGWMKNEWMDGWKKERVNEWREGERKRERTKVILEKAEKEGIRRISVFLEEPLSDQNKINAINTFAPSILTFLMPVLYFSHKDLNEVELKIKCILTKKWARHPQHLNTLLYASRL